MAPRYPTASPLCQAGPPPKAHTPTALPPSRISKPGMAASSSSSKSIAQCLAQEQCDAFSLWLSPGLDFTLQPRSCEPEKVCSWNKTFPFYLHYCKLFGVADNCRYVEMPGTNVSGIREGEEYLYLESKSRMKHPVQHHAVCAPVRSVVSCRTMNAVLPLPTRQTPPETCRGKTSPGSLQLELIWCLFFFPGFSSLPSFILSLAETQH